MKVKRQYMVFSQATGMLVASLPWDSVQQIYGSTPDYFAVYINRKGRHQVRFIYSGLDADARENDNELSILKDLRFKHGFGDSLPR